MIKKNEEPSRRDMIRWSALASTSVLVAACSSSSSGNSSGTQPDGGNTNAAAVTLLNALLSAEWVAIATYTAGAGILSAPPKGDPLAASAPVFLAVATHFQSQHTAHAGALVSAIDTLDGTPVAQSSVTFTPPAGFTATVTNVLKLAANAEKAASIAYNATVPQLPVADDLRFLAGSILGDETQHFVLLYSLLQGVAAAGPNVSTDADQIAPTDFTSTVGAAVGLQSVADFAYT
jgi:bacterioferritin (cytochrome b1)